MNDRFNWEEYFVWLVEWIDDGDRDDMLPVLSYLFKKEYVWYTDLNATQAMSSMDLRERFDPDNADEAKEERPCSVLELLVALAVDIEENICGVYGHENPARWFWEWLNNLGIDDRCTGRGYSKDYLDQCIDDWLEGDITRSGKRSPFPIKRKGVDQRKKTLWMQCMAYVNENM